MTVTMSEALAGCFAQQPDVPDDMLELLTDMVVDDGSATVSEWLLKQKELPFVLAEKLVARHGVSAAELAAFAAREDIPSETLQAWVRKERRVTVLAQIAAKPDLPQEVFEMLATREGAKLQTALLFNVTAPVAVRAGIAADLFATDRMTYDAHRELRSMLDSDELLQRAVFDRLSPDVLLQHVKVVSDWEGLTVPQLHSLLEAVEQRAVATMLIPVDEIAKANKARQQARTAVRCLADHPFVDTRHYWNRLEKFAADYPTCWPRTLDEAVAATRQRLALLGDYCGSLHSAPYSKLVELADSGVLGSAPATIRATRNPLFDADIAVKILEYENRFAEQDVAVERQLRNWAPDLASAVRVHRAMNELLVFMPGLSEHVRTASTDELVAALDSVADSPAWGLRLAEAIAAAGIDDDEVVGRFGWFPDHVATANPRHRVGALTAEYLQRRFGAHRPTWQVFGSIADPSTSLAEAADLAVHAEPPPNPGPADA